VARATLSGSDRARARHRPRHRTGTRVLMRAMGPRAGLAHRRERAVLASPPGL